MSYPRVLILSSKFGGGHFQVGEALVDEFQRRSSSIEARHIDFGSFFYFNTDFLMQKAYFNMIRKTPKLWRLIYEKTIDLTADSCRKLVRGLDAKKLFNYIDEYYPDVIVCTHFIPAAILAEYKVKGLLSVPLVTVVTDYLVHGVWVHSGIDKYVVGCTDAKNRLLGTGISADKIALTGIPVRSCFEDPLSKIETRQKLGLDQEMKTLLIMGGAGGPTWDSSHIKEFILRVKEEIPVQFMVVCGSNKELYNTLLSWNIENNFNIKLYGYVENVQELMAASDLLITKGGALTITEALTVGLPVLMYRPIPGHEKGNAFFVENLGAGKTIVSLEELVGMATGLFHQLDKLQEMSLAARKILPKNSAQNAVESIISLRENGKIQKYQNEAIV